MPSAPSPWAPSHCWAQSGQCCFSALYKIFVKSRASFLLCEHIKVSHLRMINLIKIHINITFFLWPLLKYICIFLKFLDSPCSQTHIFTLPPQQHLTFARWWDGPGLLFVYKSVRDAALCFEQESASAVLRFITLQIKREKISVFDPVPQHRK